MIWLQCNEFSHEDHLGFIPSFFDPSDERSAIEQVNEKYCDYWHEMKGLTLDPNADHQRPDTYILHFPGDPPLMPLWCGLFRDKMIMVYDYGITAIFEPDMSFKVARLD